MLNQTKDIAEKRRGVPHSGLRSKITSIALLLAAAHLLFPNVAIDGITLSLFIVAVLPWLAPLFRSIELPGGLKVEFQELEKAAQEVKKAGLLGKERDAEKKVEPAYLSVATEDPNLALAGLRLEIERRVRRLAESHGLLDEHVNLSTVLRILEENDVVSPLQSGALRDLLDLLNRAVHGAEVDQRAVSWAMDVGLDVLTALDERAKQT